MAAANGRIYTQPRRTSVAVQRDERGKKILLLSCTHPQVRINRAAILIVSQFPLPWPSSFPCPAVLPLLRAFAATKSDFRGASTVPPLFQE